jgi:adenylate cyclase class 2
MAVYKAHFEVESKYPCADRGLLEERLQALGAREQQGEVLETDAYQAHPARDFAHTGEVLRVRRCGDSIYLTYKGPKLAGPAKTREEIEVPCGAGDDALQAVLRLLERLGFRHVRDVRKRRSTYAVEHADRPLLVTYDEVDELGPFVEVETLPASDADLPEAQAAVTSLAGLLPVGTIETRSYLRMLLERDANPAGR